MKNASIYNENKLTTSEYCCEYIFRLSDALRISLELFFSSLIPRPIFSLSYNNTLL